MRARIAARRLGQRASQSPRAKTFLTLVEASRSD